jgi:hypothetical protein
MSQLKSRLDGHFVACSAVAAAAAVGGVASNADASIVYSGLVNLPVQTTTNGLYINVVTGQINEPGNTGGSTVPGWDINIYSTAQLWWSGGQLNWGTIASATGVMSVLPAGTVIDGSSINFTGTATGTGAGFPTTAPGGYFGFRFFNESLSQVEFGWARYYQPAAGGPGVLVDYAYENTGAGIAAGAPAPGSVALLALGAMGLGVRRRRES